MRERKKSSECSFNRIGNFNGIFHVPFSSAIFLKKKSNIWFAASKNFEHQAKMVKTRRKCALKCNR